MTAKQLEELFGENEELRTLLVNLVRDTRRILNSAYCQCDEPASLRYAEEKLGEVNTLTAYREASK